MFPFTKPEVFGDPQPYFSFTPAPMDKACPTFEEMEYEREKERERELERRREAHRPLLSNEAGFSWLCVRKETMRVRRFLDSSWVFSAQYTTTSSRIEAAQNICIQAFTCITRQLVGEGVLCVEGTCILLDDVYISCRL